MNAWPQRASYPCGNFSDTSCLKLVKTKGSRGPAFAVCIRTENLDQASICPFALREVSVLAELALGHLRYHLTDVPPQSNSPPDTVLGANHVGRSQRLTLEGWTEVRSSFNRVSKETMRVVVFHCRKQAYSHLRYTSHVSSQSQNKVKLNRVFFPCRNFQARSLGCGFAR